MSDTNSPTEVRDALTTGSRFGGTDGRRFIVEKEIGRGGQAAVFRTRDTRLDRIVALKLCTAPGGRARRLFLERFERELKLTSRVNHPHVLQVYDAGELPGGFPFVLLEFMKFGSLVQLAERVRRTGKQLPLTYLRYYATAIAAALRACHAAHVIHRDIKPDNVLIGQGGVAKLTDFGVSLDIAPDALRLTETGQTVGTLGFMAPEQLGGLPGPQSDIFSLGVTLYTLLTGRLPEQEMTTNRIPTGDIIETSWDQVPAPVRPLLIKMTELRLAERAASCDEVLDLVAEVRWEDVPGDLLGKDELPPLPTGAYTSGQTGVMPISQVVSRSELNAVPSDEEVEVVRFADTLDLTVQQQEEQEVRPTQVAPDSVPMPIEPEAGPTRPMSLAPEATPSPPPAPEPRTPVPSPDETPVPSPDETPAPSPDETPAPSPDDTHTRAMDSSEGLPPIGGRSKMPLLVGTAAAVVVGILGIVLLTGSPEPPTDEVMASALESFGLSAAGGNWEHAILEADRFAGAAAESERLRLLLGVDAYLAGEGSDLAGLADSDDGPVGSEAALVLGAEARLGSPDGYSTAADRYLQASGCNGAGCEEIVARAARTLQDACAVAPAGTAACATADEFGSERDRQLAASLVLLGDGHSAAAHERLRIALATEPNAAPTCGENVGWTIWGEHAAGLPADLRAQASTAARSAARAPADCILFGEAP